MNLNYGCGRHGDHGCGCLRGGYCDIIYEGSRWQDQPTAEIHVDYFECKKCNTRYGRIRELIIKENPE